MIGGKLAPFLEDESQAKNLSNALKIAINSVYVLMVKDMGFRAKLTWVSFLASVCLLTDCNLGLVI